MNLIIEGFMGCGKSAIGRRLASDLGYSFIDTDAEIERKQGKTIPAIFSESGEEAFRQMETSELWDLILDERKAVISLGGGTPVREANRELIKRLGKVVYLKASEELLVKRLRSGSEGRPMLAGDDPATRVRELLSEREDKYESLADLIVEIGDESLDANCRRVKEAIGGMI